MSSFDPTTTVSSDFGIFGIPFKEESSHIVLLPVPWEVTTSYGSGAAQGPKIIRNASEQIDLFDLETGKFFEKGIFMKDLSEEISALNNKLKPLAQELIEMKTQQSTNTDSMKKICMAVNEGSAQLTQWVYSQTMEILKKEKLFGLVGGDHSTPLGAVKAMLDFHGNEFGILHIDAHADLRFEYQGFKESHASIMRNIMSLPIAPQKLVQVGIRDFCEEEFEFSKNNPSIKTYFDLDLKKQLLQGRTWHSLCESILENLPQKVYISFDIDGLDPSFCPHTGTPVLGGLTPNEVFYLFERLASSGRKIIGFDLNEVSSGGLPLDEAEWDGNVGARMLYKLCGWLSHTNT